MAIIAHPLTMQDGSPEYSADDFRHVVNPWLVNSNGSAFGTLQGVRQGSPSPLCSINGLVVTVHPHTGIIVLTGSSGAYSYAITEDADVNLPDSTGNYKIAVVIDDPTQGFGTAPLASVKVFTAGTDNTDIPGLVVAYVTAGAITQEVDYRIQPGSKIIVPSLARLNAITGVPNGQEAFVSADNSDYVRKSGTWVKRYTDRPTFRFFVNTKILRTFSGPRAPLMTFADFKATYGVAFDNTTMFMGVMNSDGRANSANIFSIRATETGTDNRLDVIASSNLSGALRVTYFVAIPESAYGS